MGMQYLVGFSLIFIAPRHVFSFFTVFVGGEMCTLSILKTSFDV